MDTPRSETFAPPAAALRAWFAEEVQPHDAQLKAYLRGAFPAVRDVEDVVQESYLRVWRARATHAAGVAAAMASRENSSVQKISVADLQKRLRMQHQVIDFIPGQPEKCEHLNGPPEF
jgi:hypothetical protein